MLIIAIFILSLSINKCLTNLSFLEKINFKRLFGKEVKEKSLKGVFKTIIYLGSRVKIPCFRKKSPSENFRSFSWVHGGEPISNISHYSVNKHGSLTIHGVSVEDSGEFICTVNSTSGLYRFRHNIAVFQIPSTSLHIHFVYTVKHCTEENKEFAKDFIKSKITGNVCARKECQLSYIHSSCHSKTFANPNLRVTVAIELPAVSSRNCNIECTRKRVEEKKEEVKRRVISAVMTGNRLKVREYPREMSVSYFETEDDKICNPGFEMKGSLKRSICIPCTPGTFLEKGYCIPCHLNHYNGKFSATECSPCFGNRVTRSRGAVSEDDCIVADNDVLWILLVVIINVVFFSLVFCCWCGWKCFKRGKTADLREGRKLLPKIEGPITHQDVSGAHLAYSKAPTTSPKKATGPAVPTAGTPSIHHTAPKVIWSKSSSLKRDKTTIPPPPALPRTEATRNMNSRQADASSEENLQKQWIPVKKETT